MGSRPAMMNPIGRLWQHCAMADWRRWCLVGSCELCAQGTELRSRPHWRNTFKDSVVI